MEQKDGSISGAVKVGKLRGGFLVQKLDEAHGEVKVLGGDHLCTVETKRPAEYGDKEFNSELEEGEAQKEVTRLWSFVLDQDAAKTLGVFLEETVEEENARLAEEAAENPPATPPPPTGGTTAAPLPGTTTTPLSGSSSSSSTTSSTTTSAPKPATTSA